MGIITGQKSIGMGNYTPQPATLPPLAIDPATHLRLLEEKIDQMHAILEGKADRDRLKTLIAFSDEAFLIQAQQIALVGEVTIGAIINEQNGTTSGQLDSSFTRIVGGLVQTGVITSTNWSATEGTAFDLDNGIITIGGSLTPSLHFEAGNLTISGTITADSFIDARGVSDVLNDLDSKLDSPGVELLLDAGVATIFAGIGQDYVLDVGNSYVAAKHQFADVNGLGGPYTGTLRTGLLISANGVGMGYNDKATGAWINSVAIDSATGNGTFKGTVTADSVIAKEVVVTGLTGGDKTLEEVVSLAESGGITEQDVVALLEDEATTIQTNSSNLFSMSSTTNSAAVIIGSGGITALNSAGAVVFTLNAESGAATFKGDITGASGTFSGNLSAAGGTFSGSISGASGTFSGGLNTSGQVLITGSNVYNGISAAMSVDPVSGVGVYVKQDTNSPGIQIAANANGIGLLSQADGAGAAVAAFSSDSSGIGLQCQNSAGGVALSILQGYISKSRVTGHLIDVYTPGGALVGTYEYRFYES